MLQLECARCGEIQEAGEKSENVRCTGCGHSGPFRVFQFAPEKLIDEAVHAISQDYDFYLNCGDRIGMTLCEERFYALMNVSEGWNT
jgi:predicted  nucleic acid-binding Zn-ribbon protein